MRRITMLLASSFAAAALATACATDPGSPDGPVARSTPLASLTGGSAEFGLLAGGVSIASATTLEGFACALGPAGVTTDSRAVVTPSGNVNMVCRGRTASGPAATLVLDDVTCGTPGGVTTESHFVWTKSGQASLTCHYRP